MQPPPSRIQQLSKLPSTLNMKGIVREEKSEWEGTVVTPNWSRLRSVLFIKKKKKDLFSYLFLAALVFTAEAGLSQVAVHGLLIAVTPLVSEHKI